MSVEAVYYRDDVFGQINGSNDVVIQTEEFYFLGNVSETINKGQNVYITLEYTKK